MSEVLVLVEHDGGDVKKVTHELLTLASQIGDPAAVVVGAGADKAVETLAGFGASKVYVAGDTDLDTYVVTPKVAALQAAAEQAAPSAILIASTAEGKEVGGRLALRLGSGIVTDAVSVSPDLVSEQSVFGGSTVVTSKVTNGVPIITVRPNASPATAAGGAGTRVDITPVMSDADRGATITEKVAAERAGRPELTEAAIVVSGGRGVGSPEGFSVVEALADSLGAAVGASRAATDAGWYPHQFQVGQTGKTVSPQLYMANGISGAIQHRAGMQTSKTIVAVNKDAEAPIFDLVDFGVVGDLHEVLPQLTEEVNKRKG